MEEIISIWNINFDKLPFFVNCCSEYLEYSTLCLKNRFTKVDKNKSPNPQKINSSDVKTSNTCVAQSSHHLSTLLFV